MRIKHNLILLFKLQESPTGAQKHAATSASYLQNSHVLRQESLRHPRIHLIFQKPRYVHTCDMTFTQAIRHQENLSPEHHFAMKQRRFTVNQTSSSYKRIDEDITISYIKHQLSHIRFLLPRTQDAGKANPGAKSNILCRWSTTQPQTTLLRVRSSRPLRQLT